MVIAVDFDGTLCEDKYPDIGEPRKAVINCIKGLKAKGTKLILWTCREGEKLSKAVKWCKGQGIEFDAINDNLPEHKEKYKNNCRKVFADYYIDDKSKKW